MAEPSRSAKKWTRAGRDGRRAQPCILRQHCNEFVRFQDMSTAANRRAYAGLASPILHEAIDREIAGDLLEAGVWLFLRGGPRHAMA